MQRPFGLNRELPRKGSKMTSVYDPSVDAFVLAEQMRSGNMVVHERLDALAIVLAENAVRSMKQPTRASNPYGLLAAGEYLMSDSVR